MHQSREAGGGFGSGVRIARGRREPCCSRQTIDAASRKAGLLSERESSQRRHHRICVAPERGGVGGTRGARCTRRIYDVARKFCNSGRCAHNFTYEQSACHAKRRAACLPHTFLLSSTAVPLRGGVKLRERSPWGYARGGGTIKNLADASQSPRRPKRNPGAAERHRARASSPEAAASRAAGAMMSPPRRVAVRGNPLVGYAPRRPP